jgi:hypothetical protein
MAYEGEPRPADEDNESSEWDSLATPEADDTDKASGPVDTIQYLFDEGAVFDSD